tara:strand:- start:215 stop:373 length:159 start_codon:yes stop_codon:yes gene_type:complete
VETQPTQQFAHNTGASVPLLSHNFDAFDINGHKTELARDENPVEGNKGRHSY